MKFLENNIMKKYLRWQNLFYIIGIILVSTFANGNQNGGSGILGVFVIACTITYVERNKRLSLKSSEWKILEVISSVYILFHIILSVINSNWYNEPITFFIIPIIFLLMYFIQTLKYRNINKPQCVSNSELDSLERLHVLKNKGVITKREFEKKKKKILKI